MLLLGSFTAVLHRDGLLSATIITTTRDSISSRLSRPLPHARADLHLATLIHSPSSLSLVLVKPSVPHHQHHTVIAIIPRIFHYNRKKLIRLAVQSPLGLAASAGAAHAGRGEVAAEAYHNPSEVRGSPVIFTTRPSPAPSVALSIRRCESLQIEACVHCMTAASSLAIFIFVFSFLAMYVLFA